MLPGCYLHSCEWQYKTFLDLFHLHFLLHLCTIKLGPQSMDMSCEVPWVLRVSGGTKDKWPPRFSMKENPLEEVDCSCDKFPGNSSFCSFTIFRNGTGRENARHLGEWRFPITSCYYTYLCWEVTRH